MADVSNLQLARKKYTFFVSYDVATAIVLSGIMVKDRDQNWMADKWFILAERTLASSLCPEPGKRRWFGANKKPPCLIHVTGVRAKRIFQLIELPKAIIWEERLFGTCVWALPKDLPHDFPVPL